MSQKTLDKPNILIVDDKPENLRGMQRTLCDLNAELHFCHSGQEALNLLVRHDFALAILDVQMPVMDGFELAELMTHNGDTDQIPIIFVTAISKERKHISKGYHSGAVDYIFKPFDPDLLVSKARVFLELYQQRMTAKALQSQQSFILNEVTDGWWEWELGSQKFFSSEKFKRKLGYGEHELKDKLDIWQDLIIPEDLEKSQQFLAEDAPLEETREESLRFRHKDGHNIWMLCRGVRLGGKEGEPDRLVGAFTDITPTGD